MGLTPDAVINCGDLNVADLVFVDAIGRLKRRFRMSQTYELQPLTQPEAGSDGDRRQDARTPRRDMFNICVLLRPNLSRRPESNDFRLRRPRLRAIYSRQAKKLL
jgi:hypothetical protein